MRNFKSSLNSMMPVHVLSAVACMLLFSGSVAADSVTGEENANGTVQSITATEVKLKEGQSIPVIKVRKIEFDSFLVAAKESGVILKDGTRLTGIFRDTPEGQVFRSTALGPIKLKTEEIAIVFNDTEFLGKIPGKELAPPVVIDTKGNIISGKIMWADSKSTGIKTSEGLKKVPVEEISLVCYAAFKPGMSLLLRNGDIINLEREFKGESVSAKIGDRKFDIPLKSIKEINIKIGERP
ncbi:MAG: hypothetical protein WCP55_24105 [Lentisphaerota bacterium]